MSKTYMEYKEVRVPAEITDKLEQIAEAGDPQNPATLGAAGFFDWLTEQSKTEGWRAVWSGFNFPFIVLEREVVLEEV